MRIDLKPEQARVLIDAVKSGLAETPSEALDHSLEGLKHRLLQKGLPDESVAAVACRLATFGKRHGLSLGGLTIKELLSEGRP